MVNLEIGSKFSNLKLRSRIIMGYSVPLLLSIGITGLVYSNIKEVDRQNKRQIIGQEMVKNSDRIALSIARVQRSARSYLLEADGESLQDFDDGEELFELAATSLEQLVEVPEQKQRLATIVALGNKSIELNRNLIELVKSGRMKEALQKYASTDRQNLNRQLEKVLDDFNQAEDFIQGKKNKESEAALSFLNMIVVLCTLMSAILAIPIGFWIASRITAAINESVNEIATSSTQIASTVEEQQRTANQQASAVHQTTTTMDELGASSRRSAEQAEMSAVGARQALSKAEEGSQAVVQTLEEMAILKEKVEAIAQQILHLSQHTNQIGYISGVVSDLANQTNMLALNAAVEAVRAGEHGKGFGVVASEIRKLADASKKSADKINILVADIQRSINSTVMVTSEGTKTAEEGELIVQQTAAAFTGVTEAINNVFTNSQQISLNAKQQAVAIQQVVEAMNALNAAAVETASNINQTKVGIEKLNAVALNLKTAV
ncbi:methyl-accepting chemotaxis protein [Aerosakkonema funiforme]|uniref:methyl-accepting chemotaxis protein n=1 Tax=Aerosakkonema funiforme TaxID=1246630 RepID=UPI0035B73836